MPIVFQVLSLALLAAAAFVTWEKGAAKGSVILLAAVAAGLLGNFSRISSFTASPMSINANMFQTPPVTEQQKDDAMASLQSELKELATFPNRTDDTPSQSVLISDSVDRAPHRLYATLLKYYGDTIKNVPLHGSELRAYEIKYYQFERDEKEFEDKAIMKIGELSHVSMRQAWQTCFNYVLSRSSGYTKEQIIAVGGIMIMISYDQAESIYQQFKNDPSTGPIMSENLRTHSELVDEAKKILQYYKDS